MDRVEGAQEGGLKIARRIWRRTRRTSPPSLRACQGVPASAAPPTHAPHPTLLGRAAPTPGVGRGASTAQPQPTTAGPASAPPAAMDANENAEFVSAGASGAFAGARGAAATRYKRESPPSLPSIADTFLARLERQAPPPARVKRESVAQLSALADVRNKISLWNRSGGGPVAAAREFKEMVRALHAEGIEVILDVVYNHTVEGE